jgi:diguanylate cyclase (GGDEF)-like protein
MVRDNTQYSLEDNVGLLNSKVSKYAVRGVIIALVSIAIATIVVGYQLESAISLKAIINAQKSNFALWILDLTPFIFAVWGQHVSTVLTYQASAIIVDQTQDLRKHNSELEHKVRHEGMHDSVSKLPNQFLFSDRLSTLITTSMKDNEQFALFTVNISNYKEMRESLGSTNCDRLVQHFVSRLSGVFGETNTIARLNDDEFGILYAPIYTVDEAMDRAEKLNKALVSVFVIDDINIRLITAIGIGIFPNHGTDADTLWQRSNVALNVCLKNHASYLLYDKKLDTENPNNVLLMGELQHSIENNNLLLHYQPKMALETGEVIGAEALVRWCHPKLGIIPPDEFIPLAERTGLVHELSQWVIKEAIKQCAEWHRSGIPLSIAINLSPIDIIDVNLPDFISSLVIAHDVKPEWIELEIVESSVIHDLDTSLQVLTRLSQMGFKLSVDDFGTGYSSLSYLSKLPVEEVKIDRSLVMSMVEDKSHWIIVKATVEMAHNLGLKAVAEGVASEELHQRVKELNCDYGQGYHYSQPLTSTEFVKWYYGYQQTHQTESFQIPNAMMSTVDAAKKAGPDVPQG